MKNKIKNKIKNIFNDLFDLENRDISREMRRIALNKTANYVLENMYTTPTFNDKFELLRYSIKQADGTGLFLEFGVYKGKTIDFISDLVDRKVYGFDSFEGLPEDWRSGFLEKKFYLGGGSLGERKCYSCRGIIQRNLTKFFGRQSW